MSYTSVIISTGEISILQCSLGMEGLGKTIRGRVTFVDINLYLFSVIRDLERMREFLLSSRRDHVLSELFTMIRSSWVALQGWLIAPPRLHMPLCHDKAVIYEGV